MKQSTSFAQVAKTNQLFSSMARLRLLLVMFLTLTVTTNAWAEEYEKYSGTITEGDYLIVYSNGAMQNTVSSDRLQYSDVTVSNNKISNPDASLIWHIAPNGSYWTIYNAKVSKYAAGTKVKNKAQLLTSGTDERSLWTVSGTSTYEFVNKANKAASVNSNLRRNGTYGFACYATGTGGALTLYKKVAAVQTVAVTGVSLNKTSLTLTEGSSETLSASVSPDNATDKTVTWTTNKSSVATVSDGKVTAVAEGSATITVTTNDGNKTATCTVTVTPKPKYTVTWDVNGDQSVKTQVTEGSKPTFPATPKSCDDESDTFYGWSTAKWDGKINDVNDKIIYTSANEMPEVNDDVTYYAVFAKEGTSGSGTAGWSTVTSTNDLEAGATYAISSAATGGNYLSTYTGANNFPYSTTTICKLVLGGSEGAWTFKINDASSYNNYYLTATSTTGSNYLKATSTIDDYCKFSISFANAGNAVITCTGKQSRNILRYNSTNNPPIFACYSSGQNAVYLQKYSTGSTTTYSDYITTCSAQPSPLATPTGLNVTNITSTSATLSWGAVTNASGYKVTVVDGDSYNKTISVEKNNTSITLDDLTQLTTYSWTVIAIGDGTNYTNSDESETKVFTTQKACEQLGAATGLTVETDFVQDGQTYVKFSWTPADNTKNYATNQKICFGKVDEAGTCVDTLAKNLTWTGDLKSKLEPGEYWWSIQALGDGNTYCDGNVVNGANFTIEAPTYTVEWFVNGDAAKGTPTTSVVAGQTVTALPTTPASTDCDGIKEFVGWTDAEITGTSANAPTNLYKELGDFPAINANTIYYAVFASQGGADVWQETDIANISASDEVVITMKFGETSYALTNGNGTTDAPEATIVEVNDNTIKSIFDEIIWNIVKDNDNLTIYPNGDATKWLYCTDTNNGVRVGTNANKTFTIDAESGYLKNTATSRYVGVYTTKPDWRCYTNTTNNIANQTLAFYKKTSSLKNYSTTCMTPVWETDAATIDKTSFTVNCGERSPMTGANGAAKITFPTEKIYNFTSAITIEATTGFLVSTSQSVDANYKSSVFLSPRAGNPNANTFYEKPIYVRAEAPSQSDTDLEGTITIKNSKGETLQTFSVTADVTCTQYTLTLIDRGVSTEQATKYYAGETIDEAPAGPEGVCTDPIHYVFDGWAEATVAAGATTYTQVTFPYTVEGNTKFYAVYRYVEEGSGDGNYYLVENDLGSQWAGEYLIVSGTKAFDGSLSSLDVTGNNFDVTISNKTIEATDEINQKTFTIKSVEEYYTIQSKSGKYIGAFATGNLNNNTEVYDDRFYHTLGIGSPNNKALIYSNKGDGVELQTNGGRFRYYTKNNQTAVYLYKKADGTTYYTTSPVCGPHLAITEGKDIYVTGGNADGTRDLVIAQQKVSYKATRLNVGPTSQVPDVKVATNGITVGGVVTSDVKVTIDQTKEQQTDGTYTITGTITVQYQPSANNKQEDIQVQLAVDYNAEARDNFTVHARSLPSEFVIVAKSGDKWYALNGDMNNGTSANPANGQVTLDDDANPTKATYAPCNTIYTFDGVPNTGDRTRVRFQGTDGAWLWAASGTNVGIQNKSLKETPEGNNKAYNWKLETDDNITYKFHNDNNSRLLGLNGEKFGMYASGVQDIRILPYVEKCLYNYAPSNLKVSVLKGTYVTLTWDAVAGATKYQYRTDTTNWTDCGTEPTATINDLTVATGYTYYIRAYHEDTGVSQECIDYAEITFTTADCDDVPTDITYTADLNSITVSWTAAAQTATITYNTKEDGTGGGGTINNATSPYKISGGLDKNTTYYLQIFSNGTCASPIVPVKTEDVEVDIVEWQPQGIIVDINTDETIGVTLENEVSYGSGLGTEATELFFSKYYEASYNVKLVAIYNGTKNIIDLTDYIIKYGKTSWETNYITLKDFGATKGQIQPGEEIILYSYTENNADDKKILDCVHEDFPDGNWVRVTSANNEGKGTLSFAGDKTLALFKGADIIDIIGAVNGSIPNNSKANEKPSWGDKEGWVCETGLSIADDSQIGISTNRCLLIRNNTVTSGDNAVTQNIDDFVTLCSEWKGAHVPDDAIDNGVAASCENFAYVGTFDYSDYYTKFVPMGEGSTFDENARNADGTVTIPITDLYKHACSNIRVKLTNSVGDVLSNREYKVPIMITTTQGTDGEAFIALQQNLATKEVDGEGNVINTYPLSLDEVREICKTCDVVVRDNATLTKIVDDAANDHPQVHDVFVYENSSLIVPNGTNYTINSLSLRRKEDAVASVSAYPDALKLPESAAAPISLDFRLSAESWHWFTLPYDCNISEVTWVDGSPAQYNVDWFLMTYDGEKRAATQAGGCWKAHTGTTIKAGEGFILAINGNINNPKHTYELRFPMSKEVLAAEGTDKTVDVRAWGVENNIRPNHKGWNLIGNPYLAYYQRNNITNFEGLRLGQLTGPDPQTGYWEQTGDVPYVVVPVGAGWIAYEQVLASETDLLPFTAYFVQVGKDGTHNSDQDLKVSFDHTKLQLSATPMPASIIQRSASVVEEPVIVGVSLNNAKGESDKTSLIIDDQYTDEYEMNADFFKWFGDYYKYYTKPVLYTIGADDGKRAFNAISEELATQPISLGMYAAQAGNYTFSLDLRSDLSKVQEVWLYDATQDTYTNLLQDSYTFQTAKTESAGRFFLSVKMAPKVSTDINNVTDGTIWATTQDHTIIVNGLLSNAQLWIYDATGKLLHTDHTLYYQHSYSVPQSGTYFVRVQNTIQTQTIKVVVK